MKIKEFQKLIEKTVVLDGATGTELHSAGLPDGICPELWALEHPEKLMDVQKRYIDAGSDIIYTCTFGANSLKLSEFDLSHRTSEINEKLARISRKAAGKKALVAGNIGPTGKFVEPSGDLGFEKAVEIFKEQASGLLKGGVDLFIIETIMDIQEARAALIAIKEICELPVLVSMTFTEQGQTLTGTCPVTALITLQSLGAAAVGCNCSVGPQAMLNLIRAMKPCATVPLIAKPNAGLPKLIKGKTVFDMKADEFASFGKEFVEAGVNLIGGCCGTTPEYISKLSKSVKSQKPVSPLRESISAITSPRKTVYFTHGQPLKVIGERINPTGKKLLQEELKNGKFSELRRFAIEQKQKGADILDVNAGMPGIDEKSVLTSAVKIVSQAVDLPISVDSSNPDAVEAALRIYPGRALLNSISAEKNRIEKFLPIAAKYGAMFILLPLGDNNIPQTARERTQFVNEIMKAGKKYGFKKDDVLVDGLVMTVSSNQEAAKETLAMVRWSSENGFSSLLGLSNVSFGLPERKWVNSAFLAMGIGNGLTAAIANPECEELMSMKYASDVLAGRDKDCRSYISHFQNRKKTGTDAKNGEKKVSSPSEKAFQAVLLGDREHINHIIDEVLKSGLAADKIVEENLIPAINKVGDLFDCGQYFLPQLISSAETMKTAFDFLEPHLKTSGKTAESGRKHKIILATVKGDIHDIGKNIVSLMFRNYGFDVIDLGKDVGYEKIISEVKKSGAGIVGLSALMTTTMTQMKIIIDECRKSGLKNLIFVIGGAVVTQAYADEIGADGYAPDSVSAVRLVQKLLK